jgi:hypothetical protein
MFLKQLDTSLRPLPLGAFALDFDVYEPALA